MAEAQEWLEHAKAAILTLLDTEQALVHPEIEARLSEGGYDGSTTIDPHHITTALRELGREERIVFQRGTTRGGSTIQTIQPADQHRRATPIAEASARKRLLLARYNSWAQSNKRYPEGLIGPAGEDSVRKAILGSGTVIPAAAGAAAVSSILNVTVAGPLDSAGYLMSFDVDGVPAQPVTALFEVKNIRSWVYPGAGELFQLLSKAVVVQAAHPTVPILPIFICRRAHPTTFYMAKQLGFFVIEMRRQPIGPVETEPFLEVRNGLAFTDLITGSDANPQVQKRLTTVLPKFSASMSAVWRETALDPPLRPGHQPRPRRHPSLRPGPAARGTPPPKRTPRPRRRLVTRRRGRRLVTPRAGSHSSRRMCIGMNP